MRIQWPAWPSYFLLLVHQFVDLHMSTSMCAGNSMSAMYMNNFATHKNIFTSPTKSPGVNTPAGSKKPDDEIQCNQCKRDCSKQRFCQKQVSQKSFLIQKRGSSTIIPIIPINPMFGGHLLGAHCTDASRRLQIFSFQTQVVKRELNLHEESFSTLQTTIAEGGTLLNHVEVEQACQQPSCAGDFSWDTNIF